MRVPSMRCSRLEVGFLLICVWSGAGGGAWAVPSIPDAAPAAELLAQPRRLQLIVYINGYKSGFFEEFVLDPVAYRFAARRSGLEEAGLRLPGKGKSDDIIFLDELGIHYRYAESEQAMYFVVGDDQRKVRVYDSRPALERLPARSDTGAILNYSLFGGSIRDMRAGQVQFSGANASLDARAFSPFGILSQSAIVGPTIYNSGFDYLRLDSTYTFSDADRTMTYRAGDTISGAVNWSRPIRLGGLQVMSDFTMRSDIVTRPLPLISGTAAVPSTVDVMVNGVKTYSQEVAPGPYNITNLPLYAGGGDARVVVRDASGQAVETTLSLFNPGRLLAPGLTDFSLESGFARRNYGLLSDDYDGRPIGSGTWRYGITDWLTFESHGEGGASLINGGAGTVTRLGPFGTLSIAAAGSTDPRGTGAQVYTAYEGLWGRFSLAAGVQYAFGAYDDLAAVTADFSQPSLLSSGFTTLRPPRMLERVSLGMPVLDDLAVLSLSFINLVGQDNTTSRIATVSLSRSLPDYKASLFVSAFAEFGATNDRGVLAGVSFPLWDGVNAWVGAGADKISGGAVTAEASKPQQLIDNTYGWRVRSSLSSNTASLDGNSLTLGSNSFGEAAGSYRGTYGLIGADVLQSRYVSQATGHFDGSVGFLGGDVFAANRIDQSFAVVNAGAPGVSVMQDNRTIGTTDWSGKYVVTNLRPWERNTLGIDPQGMPVNFDASRTQDLVVPKARSGVRLDFGGRGNAAAALVIFLGPNGKPLPLGVKGHVDGAEGPGEEFIVGHDGRAYVKGLSASNSVAINLGTTECHASFDYAPVEGKQTLIRGIACL
jgi:outer membrane usher protein